MSNWNLPPQGGHMDKPHKIYLSTMNMKDCKERLEKDDVIIIPMGSMENHGNSGPVGEDVFIACRIAEMVAEKTGCTLSPPIYYGSHPAYHLGQFLNFPVPDEIFCGYIRAIISGLWNSGFRKMIFISLHGQEYSTPVAIQEWHKRYQVPAMVFYVDIPRVMAETLKDKKNGGPFNNPMQHACEAEQSVFGALCPEMFFPEQAENTEVKGYLPYGHVDRGGDIYMYPIPGHCQVGNCGLEVVNFPEGTLGHAKEADPKKAIPAIEKVCNYLEKLHNDILEKFPVGKLPPLNEMSQRSREEMEEVIKGVRKGGRHIYTIAWPC
ncbi:MAG: creatininase family protein [Syntrophaceae bacterium]|nr:creatininase family protein [Syntrophaceae bacterium]